MAVAIARERPRVALAVIALMALAPFTAETLKPLLAHPHDPIGAVSIGAASWPSGHSTAALALVLSAMLVAPPRLRPLVASLGAAFALVVGCSLLILAWHMPSDVHRRLPRRRAVGGAAVAALRAADRRWPSASAPSEPRQLPALPCVRGLRVRRAPTAPLSPATPDAPASPSPGLFAARPRMNSRSDKPVQVAHDLGIDLRADGDRAPLGAAADRAAHVQVRRRGRAAGDHERAQRLERRVDLVARLLEPQRVVGAHTQARALRATRRRGRRDGEVGADVEQVVLHAPQPLGEALGHARRKSVTPITAFSSSTVPYASTRGCSLETRLMSPKCVSPSSPSFV